MEFWKKKSVKTTPRLQNDYVLSDGIASSVRRHMQKSGSKFQDNPKEAHEERPKSMYYTLWPFELKGEVRIFSKDLGTFFGLGLAIWPDPIFALIDPTLIFRALTQIFGYRVKVGLKFLGPNKFRIRVKLKQTRPDPTLFELHCEFLI